VGNRRVRIQIIADILRLGEAGKTEIGLSADLGYHQLGIYLAYLVDKGFLEQQNRGRRPIYQVTPQGGKLLQSIEQVTQSLGIDDWRSDY